MFLMNYHWIKVASTKKYIKKVIIRCSKFLKDIHFIQNEHLAVNVSRCLYSIKNKYINKENMRTI